MIAFSVTWGENFKYQFKTSAYVVIFQKHLDFALEWAETGMIMKESIRPATKKLEILLFNFYLISTYIYFSLELYLFILQK
jgi:hypothetical protein